MVQAAIPSGTDYSFINKSQDAEAAYRSRSFCAYLPLSVVKDRLRTNNYSMFENPTGIYYTKGEQVTVDVQGDAPHGLTYIIHNFDREGGHAEIPLKSGLNTFAAPTQGLGYFNYRSENPQTAPELKVRLEGGYVNGVFTQHDDASTWKRMLANARGNILDILGERVQLAYSVEDLQKHCPDRGPELLQIYDDVLQQEQDILGWERYNCHPGNHVHGRVQWQGFMHADNIGTAYVNTAMKEVADVESLKNSVWAIAHEFGHINQCRPGMMWGGTQEVTNNIFSAWSCYKINPNFCRLEHETTPVMGYHERMRGGRFDCYINAALVRRQLWQFMTGPDHGLKTIPGRRTGDHFVSLAPLWQLQLYFAAARGNDGFYPYIYEQARKDAADTPHGQLRVAFCTRAADAVQLDLSEFFVKTGILAPMNRLVEDYQSHHVTITREMCEKAIAHMRQYPKPDSRVIYYISANTMHIFRDRLPVKVSPDYTPDVSKGIVTIPADKWENAVAFECYRGKRLCRVALRGLNHEDNATTDLIVPKGTTSIRAVQWDGKRYAIWKAPK
ncbi:MAG: M60 family metallopeptidase [Akkermansia sp.]|nr:M60 family metallopeptidase [Akkermansia sp.]